MMIPLMIDDQYAKMPWDKIDSVVFDVGRVLLSFEPRKILEEQFPNDPLLREKLRVKMFESPYWVMMDHGLITNEEAAHAMTGLEEELRPAINQVLENWIDLKDTIPEGIKALHVCKKHQKKVYALTNYMSAPFAHAYQRHSFFQLFDDIVVSGRIKMIKPDSAIYAYATQQFHLDPQRTLFIDDSPANIEAALLYGWQGLCYNAEGKLDAFFAE